jgi:hypothetical protein
MLTYIIIYFLYGLAFFSMGILVALEGSRSSDERLRKALRPLIGFGIVHGVHEFLKMFGVILVELGHTAHWIFWLIGNFRDAPLVLAAVALPPASSATAGATITAIPNEPF